MLYAKSENGNVNSTEHEDAMMFVVRCSSCRASRSYGCIGLESSSLLVGGRHMGRYFGRLYENPVDGAR